MGNTVSEYFTDEDLEFQLQQFFDEENIVFKHYFNQIIDMDDHLELTIKGRCFNIDPITGSVSEVRYS